MPWSLGIVIDLDFLPYPNCYLEGSSLLTGRYWSCQSFSPFCFCTIFQLSECIHFFLHFFSGRQVSIFSGGCKVKGTRLGDIWCHQYLILKVPSGSTAKRKWNTLNLTLQSELLKENETPTHSLQSESSVAWKRVMCQTTLGGLNVWVLFPTTLGGSNVWVLYQTTLGGLNVRVTRRVSGIV